MSYELKNIKVLGYSTDFNQCECCGKSNLKGTVSIIDLRYDVVLHFGSVCAVKADKYDTAEAFREAKKMIKEVIYDYKSLQSAAWDIALKNEEIRAMVKAKDLYTCENYNPMRKPTFCMDCPEFVVLITKVKAEAEAKILKQREARKAA